MATLLIRRSVREGYAADVTAVRSRCNGAAGLLDRPTRNGRSKDRPLHNLRPSVPVLLQRQRAHARARGREDRVADRRQNRRQRRLAEARSGCCPTARSALRSPRRLPHPQRTGTRRSSSAPTAPFSIVISHAHQLAQAVDDGAVDLRLGVERVDDLAADVAGDPDLVHLARASARRRATSATSAK